MHPRVDFFNVRAGFSMGRYSCVTTIDRCGYEARNLRRLEMSASE